MNEEGKMVNLCVLSLKDQFVTEIVDRLWRPVELIAALVIVAGALEQSFAVSEAEALAEVKAWARYVQKHKGVGV